MPRAEASVERTRERLGPLLRDPASAAVLSDLDGTLAPIVDRPEQVAVPDRARRALERIAASYALCAIVTGRRPADAREIVGLDAIAYAGNHGFELLEPGAAEPVANPALAERAGDAAAFVERELDLQELEAQGIRCEDKGPIVALHWRGAADEPAAEARVEEVASAARERGLFTHLGRKVLELRPAVEIDKGVAIEALLDGLAVRAVLYAGDDRTDVDGFRALGELRDAGRVSDVVRVGVRSPEGPEELLTECDLAVDGPEDLLVLLELLAG